MENNSNKLLNKKAPEFKAKALVEGKEMEISLKDYLGKKIILYFYPKDLTPGCTVQACNLRDNYSKLKKEKIIVIGVSKDSIKSHIKFKDKENLPFILVSDEDTKINQLYNVWAEKSLYGKKYMGTLRTTFLIDEKGIITNIIYKPSVSSHSEEIFEIINLK